MITLNQEKIRVETLFFSVNKSSQVVKLGFKVQICLVDLPLLLRNEVWWIWLGFLRTSLRVVLVERIFGHVTHDFSVLDPLTKEFMSW